MTAKWIVKQPAPYDVLELKDGDLKLGVVYGLGDPGRPDPKGRYRAHDLNDERAFFVVSLDAAKGWVEWRARSHAQRIVDALKDIDSWPGNR